MPAYVYSHMYNNLDYYPAAPEMEITISHADETSLSAELVALEVTLNGPAQELWLS